MSIRNYNGTLQATKYAGSQPPAHPSAKVTSGTIGRARVPFLSGSYTGSQRSIAGGGSNIAPPNTPRFVSLGIKVVPSSTLSSGIGIIQQRFGTLTAAIQAPLGNSDELPLAAIVLPGPSYGSWMIRNVGGNGGSTLSYLREENLR